MKHCLLLGWLALFAPIAVGCTSDDGGGTNKPKNDDDGGAKNVTDDPERANALCGEYATAFCQAIKPCFGNSEESCKAQFSTVIVDCTRAQSISPTFQQCLDALAAVTGCADSGGFIVPVPCRELVTTSDAHAVDGGD